MEIACVLIATRFALVGAAPKPHIVFFMADDLVRCLSFYLVLPYSD